MKPILAIVFTTFTVMAHANADAPYAGEQHRAIKALSSGELDDLRMGRGMGFSKAAELNGYPGPRHVLDHAEALALTPAQMRETEALFGRMQVRAKALGAQLIAAEQSLDQLFASGEADEATLDKATEKAARIRGQLRAVHLNAHRAQRALLAPQQIAAYDRLRGYVGDDARTQSGHQSHGH